MKFSTSSGKIAKHLKAVSTVIGSKNMLPILDHVLLKVAEGHLYITATDIQTSLRVQIDIEDGEDGSVAVPYRMFSDMLNTFAQQPLDFESSQDTASTDGSEGFPTYSLKITSNQGTYQMMCCDPEDFPEFKELEAPSQFALDSSLLGKALKNTLHSCSNDDMKINLNGVLFELTEDEMNFVSTDGLVLSKYTIAQGIDRKVHFTVDKKPLNTLKNLISELEDEKSVKIHFNETNVKFTINGIEMTCSIIAGKFPDYKSIIPKNNTKIVQLNKAQFLNSIRRLSIFSDKITHTLNVSITDKNMEIQAEDTQLSNKGKEVVSCSFSETENINILLSYKRTQQILSNLDGEEVSMYLKDGESIIIFAPNSNESQDQENLSILCMPLVNP